MKSKYVPAMIAAVAIVLTTIGLGSIVQSNKKSSEQESSDRSIIYQSNRSRVIELDNGCLLVESKEGYKWLAVDLECPNDI